MSLSRAFTAFLVAIGCLLASAPPAAAQCAS
jgi:hypothetical protein